MNLISSYDYACFKCPEQRRARNSLRIGISPDCTLAYIDFLFDEEVYTRSMKPLCPLGQTKLPASFRFAGLGSYFCPFYVDTNDLIFQAVAQTDVASAFIDEAWITFVVQLNIVLRKLQADGLYEGILNVVDFLSNPKSSSALGGLIVEFCTFNNVPYMDEPIVDESTPPPEIEPDSSASKRTGEPTKGGGGGGDGKKEKIVEDRGESFAEVGGRGSVDEKKQMFSIGEGWFNFSNRNKKRQESKTNEKGFELSTSDKSELRADGETIGTGKDAFNPSTSYHSGSRPSTVVNPIANFFSWLFSWFSNSSSSEREQEKALEQAVTPAPERKSTITFRDPTRSEQIMSFPEAVAAIRRGELTMGIVVSHPKVLNDVYIATEEDYESGDEGAEEDLRSISSESDRTDLGFLKSPGGSEKIRGGPGRSFDDRVGGADGRKREMSADNASLGKSSMDGQENPLVRAYGDKADQIAKFYQIMMNSENTEPSFTPTSPSAVEARKHRSDTDSSTLIAGTNLSLEPAYLTSLSVDIRQPKFGSFDLAPAAPAVAVPIEEESSSSPSQNASSLKKLTSSTNVLSDTENAPRSDDESEGGIGTLTSLAALKEKRRASLQTKLPPIQTDSYTEFSRQYPRTKGGIIRESVAGEEHRPTSVDLRFSEMDEEGKRAFQNRLRQMTVSSENPDDDDNESRFSRRTGENTRSGRTSRRYTGDGGGEGGERYIREEGEEDEEEEEGGELDDGQYSPYKASSMTNRPVSSLYGTRSEVGRSLKSSLAEHPSTVSIDGGGGGGPLSPVNISAVAGAPQTSPSFGGSGSRSTSRDGGGGGLMTSEKVLSPGGKSLSPSRKTATKKIPVKKVLPPKKPVRKLTRVHNLAPACFQHKIKAWRVTNDEHKPVTDGKLGPREIRRREMLDLEDEDEEAENQYDIENKLDILHKKMNNNNSNNSAFSFEVTDSKQAEVVESSATTRKSLYGQRKSLLAPQDDYGRESFFPNFMQLSFSARKHEQHQAQANNANNNINNNNITTLNNNNNNMTGRSSEFTERKSRTVSSMRLGGPSGAHLGGSIQKQFNYLYYNQFFLYYFTRFMCGYNTAPYGPKWFRKIFEFVVFILCLSDLCLWMIMLVNTYCASDNTTACTDHHALILVICVWPFAFVVAPLMGMTAVLLGPSGSLARSYGLWSRLAAINNSLMIFFTIKYYDYYSNLNGPGSWYLIVAVSASRVFQCTFVDLYIAHIERLRYTRGWDGLNTSLFKTKDNKKEIGL
jgi:hypothetical protein